jgi:chromate reductase
MKILAISGSLRDGSFNRLLIHAAEELAPDGVEIETFDIDDIPLYNQDEDKPDEPQSVAGLRAAIRDADALLLATPEYNYSVPGVLKNAIDWASRPVGTSPLTHKPVAIMGASTGISGTMRAQLAWRPVFLFTDSPMVGKPEVYVAQAGQKFDQEGRLTDETARTLIKQLLVNLVKLAEETNAKFAADRVEATASRH